MIKTIFFDADGVTISERKRFGNRLSEDYNIPYDKILPFFKNELALCSEGKADLKQEISKYLIDWGWNKPLGDLLDYWFLGTKASEEILEYIDKLRSRGIKCYLTTDQEKYRAEYILNELGFNKRFDKCFFSYNMGYRKIDRRFFEKVLEDIKISPQDILYWDDDKKNLEVAVELGINTEFYSDFDSFCKKMEKY